MSRAWLSPRASAQADSIYRYTLDRYGAVQARRYIEGLFRCFEAIARGTVTTRRIPAEFGVDGSYARFGQHFVYWRKLSRGRIGIVAILHVRMHQLRQFRDAGGGE
ncbi:MAG TPA: type II toxin-antitoxin system RelE/ParE family toxin [Micropepsaceae bacterium]|nr:type II toxin-antitoxin system RelE/ParE family toxin [Micropepsaceae bacterium]